MDCEICGALNGENRDNYILCPTCQEAIEKDMLDEETEREVLRNNN